MIMKQLFEIESGASLIEWGLLASLVAIVALLAVMLVGQETNSMWVDVASSVS